MTPVKYIHFQFVFQKNKLLKVLEWTIVGDEGIKDEVQVIESEIRIKLHESQNIVTSDHCNVH